MSHDIRFATWNVGGLGSSGRKKIGAVRDLKCDIVVLQEVKVGGIEALERDAGYINYWHSMALRPQRPDEGGSRALGCAILTTDRFRLKGRPTVLEDAPAPERTLIVDLESDDGPLTVASFHFVAGSARKVWGPARKRQNFEAVTAWLAGQHARTVVGLDCNSPKVDHPDVSRNRYWGREGGPGDRREYLLHDPWRAPHGLRDAYRVFLAEHPAEMDRIREKQPDGPLAVSHVTGKAPRRYDFIYVTPDLVPHQVEYDFSTAHAAKGDHAMVKAQLSVAGRTTDHV